MILNSEVTAKISSYVQELRGRELCGYLAHDRQGRQEFYPVTNRSLESNSFWLSKSDYRRLMRYLARRNFQIIAFVHSHPGSSELSREDAICLRYSSMPWIIVTIVAGQLQSRMYEPADAAIAYCGRVDQVSAFLR